MPTLKHFMGDATRGDGRKFTRDYWDETAYFEPIFYSELDDEWCGLTDDGHGSSYSGTKFDVWREWTPPKKKVIRWKWAVKFPTGTWFEYSEFRTEEEAIQNYPNEPIKKLEYTATEFDE